MVFHFKALAALLVAAISAATFTSCALMPGDISELQIPPKLTAEQQAIEQALEKTAGDKLTLKYPLEGDYRSAFILRNLGNKESSAIAFYSLSGGESGPHIAILDKVGGKWKVTDDISSEGNEINNIEFGDFNKDGNDEIAVGWRSFNSTDITLVVYTKKGSSFTKINLGTFTEMKVLDMDSDGKKDILLLQLNSDAAKAKARLISYEGDKLTEVSNSPLDSTVTSYAGVYTVKIDNELNGVLIDGYKSDNKMITELVYYNSGSLISPLYDNEKHTVNSTMRYVTYKCMDIDKDGVVDIPMPVELPYVANEKDTNKNWLVRWSDFDVEEGLTTKLSAIMNYAENYYFKYPDKWNANVTVSKSDDNSIWSFCKWDKTKNTYGKILFSIYAYNQDRWNNIPNKDNLQILAQKNGTVYAVKIFVQKSSDPLALSYNEILNYFNLFE